MHKRIYRFISCPSFFSSAIGILYESQITLLVPYSYSKDSAINEKRNNNAHYYVNCNTFVRYHNLLRNDFYNHLKTINSKKTQEKSQGMLHDVLVELEKARLLFGLNTLMVLWVLIASFCFGSLWVLSLSSLFEDVVWAIFGDVVATFNKLLLVVILFALVTVVAILVVSASAVDFPSGATVCFCFTIYGKMITLSEPS